MKGRPVFSEIRQNIVEILFLKGTAYGYELTNIYLDIFPSVTRRSIYYNLKKGLQTKEFKIEKVQLEKGNYSWGTQAEKVYYKLGPNAKPHGNKEVKKYFQKFS